MSLKRRNRINATFSMASMTDIIFLLLIFFMVTSTVVMPNAINVTVPEASRQSPTKPRMRVTIDKQGRYYVGAGQGKDRQVLFREIVPRLKEMAEKDPEINVTIYGYEGIDYRKIVEVLDMLQEYKIGVTLATRISK